MLVRSRLACLSAAVVATLYGAHAAQARDLIFDPQSTGAVTGSDGTNVWDTTTPIWVDITTPGNTTFNSTIPDSAIIGTSVTTTATVIPSPFSIVLAQNITTQNLTLRLAADGRSYNVADAGEGSQVLTVAGNIIKASAIGTPQFNLTNAIQLTTGAHTLAARDSPGDAAPEMVFNTALAGAGSIVVDNTSSGVPVNDIQYGTIAFNVDNSYGGGTTVQLGRLVANTGGALGTGGVEITGGGALAFAGAGTVVAGNMTVNNAITITRSDYTTAQTNNRYPDAVVANNDGTSNVITLNNVIVNSTDARVTANTNRIVIPNAIGVGTTVAPAAAFLDLGGDFAGFIDLSGDNTAFGTAGGTIGFRDGTGVELGVNSEANLGGPASKLRLAGGTIRPGGTLGAVGSPFMTNFGAHDRLGVAINTGLNLTSGQVFNSNGLTGVAIGTRGTGTINFNGANVFTGRPFFDGGVVNVNNDTTFGGFALRSPAFNIASGVTITTTQGGNESIVVGANPPDTSTVTIASTNAIRAAGGVSLGNTKGATGTLNNAGVLTIGNEYWVGNNGGTGTYTQTAGSMTVNNWFAVGRDVVNAQGTTGTVNFSGGTITKTGGGNTYFGQGTNGKGTFTLTNNAAMTIVAGGGEFWLGQDGGTGTMTMSDSSSFTLNNWLALGRANGASVGVLNLNGGTLTKVAGSNGFLAVGSGGTGTLNQTGGVLNISGTRVGEAGNSLNNAINLSGGTSTFINEFSLGFNGDSVGTLNISGTANVNLPTVTFGVNSTNAARGGVLNLDGGTLTAVNFVGGTSAAGAALRNFNFNGGTLRPAATNTNFIGPKVAGIVRAGGARIDTNGFDATVSAVLAHDAALGGAADGGLVKSGAGTLFLTGANTYTGATVVNNVAGVLNVTYSATGTSASSPLLTGPGGADIQEGRVVFNYAGSISPSAAIRTALKGAFPSKFATGQLRSTTNANSPSRALGYGDDTAGSAVTVLSTFFGDATLDRLVDVNDLGALASNFGSTSAVWTQGDFNYDDSVNVNDLGLLATFYGSGTAMSPTAAAEQFRIDLALVSAANPAFAAAIGGFTAAVPEPTTLAAVAVASAGLLGRRRRRIVAAG